MNTIKQNLKQFLYLLDKQAKRSIPVLIISFFISSTLDVVGIGLVGIFLAFLIDPGIVFHKIPKLHVLLPNLSNHFAIIIFGILILLSISMKSIAVVAIQKQMFFFAQEFSFRLKTRLMTAYQSAPYVYHLQKNSGYLMSRVQDNINGLVNNMLMSLLTLISNLLMTVFILIFLMAVHPYSTFLLLSMLVVVGYTYDFLIKKKLSSVGKIIAESGGDLYKSIRHLLYGFTDVRVFGREKYFSDKIAKKFRKNLAANAVLNRHQLIPRYLVENMVAIFTIAVSLVGVAMGYSAATILSLVGMYAVAGARLMPTVSQVMTSINQIRAGSRNISLVYNEFNEVNELLKQSSYEPFTQDNLQKLQFDTISLKHASFKYPVANIMSLNDINIEIKKGQSIGIIGPSGAGKSTLINMILGFLEPNTGQLLVDHQPVKTLRSWLNNFAYIPQSIFLLDDTLYRNIAFGIEDEKIDQKRLLNAINMAQLTDVIETLPEGIATPLGENGIRLSGGQRQRVALARAFYNERDIIVMDEATSSLDMDIESEVIKTIKYLKGQKTLLVIAHRLSTVEHCDLLYRLDRGAIVKVGSYQEVVGV